MFNCYAVRCVFQKQQFQHDLLRALHLFYFFLQGMTTRIRTKQWILDYGIANKIENIVTEQVSIVVCLRSNASKA